MTADRPYVDPEVLALRVLQNHLRTEKLVREIQAPRPAGPLPGETAAARSDVARMLQEAEQKRRDDALSLLVDGATSGSVETPTPDYSTYSGKPEVSGGGGPRFATLPRRPGRTDEVGPSEIGGADPFDVNGAYTSWLTGSFYLELIRTGKYPWWWGPVTQGLRQVERLLQQDLDRMNASRFPQRTKDEFALSVSAAMTHCREQRAIASRLTGERVGV